MWSAPPPQVTPVPEGKLWQGEIQWRRGLRRTAVLSIRTADGNAVAGAPTVPIMHATQKFKSGTLNMHLDLCKQVGGHRFAKIREPKKHHYVFYDNGANPKRPHKARGRPMRVTLGACKVRRRGVRVRAQGGLVDGGGGGTDTRRAA